MNQPSITARAKNRWFLEKKPKQKMHIRASFPVVTSASAKPVSIKGGFTLTELMAVMLVIGMLALIVLGITNRAQKSTNNSRARGEITALESAIESFKLDLGYYPTSAVVRISQSYQAERTNSWLLLTQISPYFKPATDLVSTRDNLDHFADPWGTPYGYYCTVPPLSTVTYGGVAINQNVTATGGQMNPVSFDLFSHGADRRTYLPVTNCRWNDATLAHDDITNWKQ